MFPRHGYVLAILGVLSLPGLALGAEPPALEAGKGQVILYRVGQMKGAAVKFNYRGTSGFAGNLPNGSWAYEQVDPGSYTYWVSSPSIDGQDSLVINVAEGQTYYVKCEIKFGWPAGRTKFEPVPEATGRADLAGIN